MVNRLKPFITSPYLAIIWCLLLAAFILAGIEKVPFHADEATIIYTARDAYYLRNGAWDQLLYQAEPSSPTEQHLRLLNGSINRYLIGWRYQSLNIPIEDINNQWDWGADWQYNLATGHLPEPDLLYQARLISAIFTAGGAILMFLIGKQISGYGVAYLASALFTINPAILLNGQRAMMEGTLLCFSLLCVWLALWIVSHRKWQWLILIGLAGGLALSSKHPAALTLVAIYLGLLIEVLRILIREKNPRPFLSLVISGFLILAIFYLLSPLWWMQPGLVLQEALHARQNLLTDQSTFFGSYADLPERLAGFFRQVFIGQAQYYEVPDWANYIGQDIQHYQNTLFSGFHFGSTIFSALILLALSILGFAALLIKKIYRPTRIITLSWMLGIILLSFVLTPLEWQRYYLAVIPAINLAVALGINTILSR